ncbi:hypothetical protein A2U01_0037473 [Trifolium medium]|uniref:Uncharacterized protein n=1 Tax=Trifolium medium TaxID=97028 RepID=A0A392PW84_9FABA|nr:hypothetical protein [Trifolium medium]
MDIEDGDEIDAALYEHWRACINIDVKGQVAVFSYCNLLTNAKYSPILSIANLFDKECGGDH